MSRQTGNKCNEMLYQLNRKCCPFINGLQKIRENFGIPLRYELYAWNSYGYYYCLLFGKHSNESFGQHLPNESYFHINKNKQ